MSKNEPSGNILQCI